MGTLTLTYIVSNQKAYLMDDHQHTLGAKIFDHTKTVSESWSRQIETLTSGKVRINHYNVYFSLFKGVKLDQSYMYRNFRLICHTVTTNMCEIKHLCSEKLKLEGSLFTTIQLQHFQFLWVYDVSPSAVATDRICDVTTIVFIGIYCHCSQCANPKYACLLSTRFLLYINSCIMGIIRRAKHALRRK